MTTLISSITTVLAVILFAGIVWWAYSARRKHDFDRAANTPFALPDDGDIDAPGARGERR